MFLVRSVPATERPWPLMRKPTPAVTPAVTGAVVAALEALVDRPGSPRWACTSWCCDLVGPLRSTPRVNDDADLLSRGALAELVERLSPQEARTELPQWIGQPSADVDVLLSLGTASGKPGRSLAVDIPPHVEGLVVDQGDGTARFRYPQWHGTPVESDGRLLALRELIGWRGDISGDIADAIRTLVSWVCGPGRAFCGRWAWERGLPETKTPAARAALPELTRLDVEDVVAQVLSW